jgi:hypothetical protein
MKWKVMRSFNFLISGVARVLLFHCTGKRNFASQS